MQTKERDRAKEQAKAQLNSIVEMVRALTVDHNGGDRGKAENIIHEDALSVQVRDSWYSPGGKGEPDQFEILLCTGGPAVRIIGDLDRYQEPENPRLEYQDWGTPWTEYHEMPTEEETEALLTYCRQFYFGS